MTIDSILEDGAFKRKVSLVETLIIEKLRDEGKYDEEYAIEKEKLKGLSPYQINMLYEYKISRNLNGPHDEISLISLNRMINKMNEMKDNLVGRPSAEILSQFYNWILSISDD